MNQRAYEEVYARQIKYFSSANRRKAELVVFSAIPGSGKSELTKRLTEEYGYFRVANKDIREAVEYTNHTDISIADYTTWLFDKLIMQDRYSFVFDRNIDQLYPTMKNWAFENDYRLIVVSIDVQRDKLEKRLLEREGTRSAKAFEMLDFYSAQHETIRENMQPSIYLYDDYDLDEASKIIASY